MERAKLIIERDGAQPFEVELTGVATIGRGPTNDVALDDSAASRRQSIVRADEDGWVVSDLGSANGTFHNGSRVLAPARLKSGDQITVGSTCIRFVGESAPEQPVRNEGEPETVLRLGGHAVGVLLGSSPGMEELFHLIQKAAASPLPTLIEGETGTGKELVARAIHEASRSGKGPFLPVNCAAVPENLLESELFGHRRGSFTGATGDHEGLFEAAQGGTVFLDEIGEMPLAMQPKVLRVLQEGEVTRIGEIRSRKVDFRLVAATNRDLLQEVERGTFRGDLFYRISAFPIRIPALRERRDDVPLLVEHLVQRAAVQCGKPVAGVSAAALAALCAYDWPGNVRELAHALERSVALARDSVLDVEDLPAVIRGARSQPVADLAADLPTLEQLKHRYIQHVVELHGGNVSRAAAVLGIERRSLYRMLRRYGIAHRVTEE